VQGSSSIGINRAIKNNSNVNVTENNEIRKIKLRGE
jgi:hypothetical protein